MKDTGEESEIDPANLFGDQRTSFFQKNLNWFEKITGLSEEDFQNAVAFDETSCVVRNDDGSVSYQHGDKIVKAGKLKIAPVLNLLNTLEDKQYKFNAPYPVLDIITRLDPASNKYVDFSYLQNLTENSGSLFQVSSNFNALQSNAETLGYFGAVNFCTRYATDYKNQGAIASISCGGAAISRYYNAMGGRDATPSECIQTKEKQICLFENIKDSFPIVNGFVWLNNNEPPFKKKEWKKYLSKISVAYQTGCEVTSGYAFSEVDKNEKIYVDQNFVSAMNLHPDTPSGIQNKAAADHEVKAQFALDAAYLSTYLVAVNQQYSQLFLTLVGLDQNNQKANIYDSIFLAHQKWARHEHGKLKSVKLIVPEFKDLSRTFFKNLRANNIPYRLIVYSNGVQKVVERFLNLQDEI